LGRETDKASRKLEDGCHRLARATPCGTSSRIFSAVKIKPAPVIAAGAAGLTFTSFGRHGGGTEANDSGLTETQLKHRGQWKTKAAMGRYLHRDDQGKQEAQEKRIKLRAKRARQAAKK
jgi:hypothetical protein